MRVTDAQVRKLMEEMSKSSKIEQSSMKAGMHRNTGSKYIRLGKLPSELSQDRSWRTRSNPFAEDWLGIVECLRDAPELESKTIFECLVEEHPERYAPGQLRTLQRHIRQWRAQEGPAKEVFFAQEHRPGEAMQTDFTRMGALAITIQGELFEHMLCHMVLPHSNWEWVTICQSESLLAIQHGVQEALFRLGRVPEYHQTDNSTAATHRVKPGQRDFNDEYKALMRHLGMKPRTIGVGKKQQNGDVESLNGALKRRIKQHLLVRDSRDFESVDEYNSWLVDVLHKANALRSKKVKAELAVMRPLSVNRLREYREETVGVSSWSTIRVKHNAYSVPSRLVGEQVSVRIYEDRLEVYYRNTHQLTVERLVGRFGHKIDYHHVIWSLVRKPGAFARYKYREDLFPSLTFRRAYDCLSDAHSSTRKADLQYLRILHLAASTMESDVEIALELLLETGTVPEYELVKEVVSPDKPEVPDLPVFKVDLSEYDGLLASVCEVLS